MKETNCTTSVFGNGCISRVLILMELATYFKTTPCIVRHTLACSAVLTTVILLATTSLSFVLSRGMPVRGTRVARGPTGVTPSCTTPLTGSKTPVRTNPLHLHRYQLTADRIAGAPIPLQAQNVHAIHFDDQMSGYRVHGNTISNSWAGIKLGGGRRTIVSGRYSCVTLAFLSPSGWV